MKYVKKGCYHFLKKIKQIADRIKTTIRISIKAVVELSISKLSSTADPVILCETETVEFSSLISNIEELISSKCPSIKTNY